jgi:hypothetical protein
MRTLELISKLKQLPETATVYFDDPAAGLIPIESIKVLTRSQKLKARIDLEKPAIVISD